MPLVQIFDAEMQSFFLLFNRFLTDQAKGEKLYVAQHVPRHLLTHSREWDRISPPKAEQVHTYKQIPNVDHAILNKLAVLKLNGGLGTTMGCVGPKSIIEVRNNMTFLDLAVRQIEVSKQKQSLTIG